MKVFKKLVDAFGLETVGKFLTRSAAASFINQAEKIIKAFNLYKDAGIYLVAVLTSPAVSSFIKDPVLFMKVFKKLVPIIGKYETQMALKYYFVFVLGHADNIEISYNEFIDEGITPFL